MENVRKVPLLGLSLPVFVEASCRVDSSIVPRDDANVDVAETVTGNEGGGCETVKGGGDAVCGVLEDETGAWMPRMLPPRLLLGVCVDSLVEVVVVAGEAVVLEES